MKKPTLKGLAASFALGGIITYFGIQLFQPDTEAIDTFRKLCNTYATRTLDIADLPESPSLKDELSYMQDKLIQIEKDDLTEDDQAFMEDMESDISDLLRQHELSRSPRPDESYKDFRKRAGDSKDIYDDFRGVFTSDNTPDGLYVSSIQKLFTGNPTQNWTEIEKTINYLDANNIDYIEFTSPQTHTTNGSLEDLTERLIFVKANHPAMQEFYDKDIGLERICEKNLNWIIFTPNLEYWVSTNQGYRTAESLGTSAGNGNIAISTKDYKGDGVDWKDRLPTFKHETQHARQLHWTMPTLSEEETPRREEVALLERLVDKYPRFQQELEIEKKTLENIDFLQQGIYGDLFASVYPQSLIESGQLLESGMTYHDMQKAHKLTDGDNYRSQVLKNALEIASIAKHPYEKDYTKRLDLMKIFNRAYKNDHEITQFNASQALAWLFPEKFERINLETYMNEGLPPIPDINRAYTTDDKMEKQRIISDYIRNNSIEGKVLFEKYKGQTITDDIIQHELSENDKKFLWVRTSNTGSTGWSKYVSTYNRPHRVEDYRQAHNITARHPHHTESLDTGYAVLQDPRWHYTPVYKDDKIVQGLDTFVQVLMVYGDTTAISDFLESGTHKFWEYGLNGVVVNSPSEDYFPFQEYAQRFDFTKQTLNETRRYSE